MEYCREYFWYYKYSTMIFIFSVFEHGPTSTNYDPFVEGSLEVKLPTIWRDEKAVSREKSQKRKDQSLKRRVRRHLGRWEMKSCTPLWCEAHFQVKMYKTHQVRTTFGSWDVEKVHAVVARSTFPSQNVQNTPFSDHFWKLRCRKSARRCGAKHISKSKCTKHTILGPLLEVEMSKKVRVVVARTTFPSQNVQSTPGPDHFWKLRCRKSARCCGAKHISKSKCTKHTMYGPLLEVRCRFAWQAQGIVDLVKSEQNVRVL